MALMRPDPTFCLSQNDVQPPPERLAYVALINPKQRDRPDAIGVLDVDPDSKSYGRLVGKTDMRQAGDELHHFGWNACSSCLRPYSPHPHMERRYLIVPGINSSRIHILDVQANPRQPELVKVIEPEAAANRTGYAAPTPCTADPVRLQGEYAEYRCRMPMLLAFVPRNRRPDVPVPQPTGTEV